MKISEARMTYVERVARLIYWLWGFLAVSVLVSWGWAGLGLPLIGRDSTDGLSERSGLGLYVDHGTGCQYLGRPFTALTPRLTAEGKPMCWGGK